MTDNKTNEESRVVEAKPAAEPRGQQGGRPGLRFDTMIVGVLLIAFGAFLLYTNYDPKFDFRELVMTWWPLIFILVGLVKIIQSMLGVPSRGSGVGWLVFGGIVILLMNGLYWVDWDDDVHFGFVSFNHKVKEDSSTIALDSQSKLILDVKRTDVSIYGYEGDEIRITEKVFIRGNDRDELEEKAENYELGVLKEQDSITLTSDPTKDIKSVNGVYVELEIEVPEEMLLQFKGYRSDLYAKDIDGDLVVKNEIGNISLDKLDGKIDIYNTRGDVDLKELIGKVEIKGKRLSIELIDVYGELLIDTERSGVEITNYEALRSPMQITTSRGTVELNIDSGSSFDFQGNASNGKVYYEFDDTDDAVRTRFNKAENGGDHKIIVKTSSGNISLEEI